MNYLEFFKKTHRLEFGKDVGSGRLIGLPAIQATYLDTQFREDYQRI